MKRMKNIPHVVTGLSLLHVVSFVVIALSPDLWGMQISKKHEKHEKHTASHHGAVIVALFAVAAPLPTCHGRYTVVASCPKQLDGT